MGSLSQVLRRACPLAVTMALTAAAFAPGAAAAPGDLDLGFGAGAGWVRTDLDGYNDETTGMALQPDGKIVVIARSASLALLRYNPDGSLDSSFSSDGRVSTIWTDKGGDFGVVPRGVTLTPDGKIVVVGEADSRGFAVARYEADGTLDKSFSGDGKLLTSFDDGGWGGPGWGNAVAVQADGKIVVSGRTHIGAAIARYNVTGTLDKSFSSDGKATTSMDTERGFSGDIAIQPDGKIVTLQGEIARYLPDGTLDPTFAGNGIIEAESPSDDLGPIVTASIELQPDGKLVVAGKAGGEYDTWFGVARFLPDGAPDGGFGAGGTAITPFFDDDNRANPAAVAVQPDGKVVVAGTFTPSNGLYSEDGELALARYLPDGSLDYRFGGGGLRTIDLTEKDDTVAAMALQADGHFALAGSTAEPTAVEDHRPGDVLLARVEGGTVFIPARPVIRGRPGRGRVSKRRSFRLKTVVSCPGAGPACSARVEVRAKAMRNGRSRAVKVGAGRFRVPAGGSRRVKARLSPRGMALLRSRGRLVATVRVRALRGSRAAAKVVRTKLTPVKAKRKR